MMGPNEKREIVKKASRSAKWAAQVDLMTDEHVDAIYKKLQEPRKKAS